MAWYTQEEVNVEDFQEGTEYNDKQLEAFATAWLKKDARENKNRTDTGILFEESLRIKRQREVLVGSGVVDEALTTLMADPSKRPGVHSGDGQKMYNRQHPRGRRVNTPEQRKRHGASYFRNS